MSHRVSFSAVEDNDALCHVQAPPAPTSTAGGRFELGGDHLARLQLSLSLPLLPRGLNIVASQGSLSVCLSLTSSAIVRRISTSLLLCLAERLGGSGEAVVGAAEVAPAEYSSETSSMCSDRRWDIERYVR